MAPRKKPAPRAAWYRHDKRWRCSVCGKASSGPGIRQHIRWSVAPNPCASAVALELEAPIPAEGTLYDGRLGQLRARRRERLARELASREPMTLEVKNDPPRRAPARKVAAAGRAKVGAEEPTPKAPKAPKAPRKPKAPTPEPKPAKRRGPLDWFLP